MRILPITITMTFVNVFCFAQFSRYDSLAISANQFFLRNDFQNSAAEYSRAFNIKGIKGFPEDKYKAAISWAMIDVYDSAFSILYHLAEHTSFLDTHEIFPFTPQFKRLQQDKRWNDLLSKIALRKKNYNDSIAALLLNILRDDQRYRLKIDRIVNQFGYGSEQYNKLWETIDHYDSLNLVIMISILDKYGWLGSEEIGREGNKAIWLVIQHAPLAIQEKYFPVMHTAVENGKASLMHLAYLQDRILIRNGKKQLYGTQSRTDFKTGISKLEEAEDPDNLNKRREWVGLPPL